MGGYQSKVIFDCQLDGLVTLSDNHFPFRPLKTFYFDFIHRYAAIQNQSEISPSETVHVVLGITSLSELLQDLVGGLVFIFSLVQWNLHISGCNLSLVPIRHFRVNLCLRYKVHISGQSLVKNYERHQPSRHLRRG